MSQIKVFYHGGCRDGFTAAYCAWLVHGDDAEYIPVGYNRRPMPDVDPDDRVYILDFSYDRETTEAIIEIVGMANLTILDHHKSAEAVLGDLPCAVFDMNKSGAMLAWEYFHQGVEPGGLVRYVQDRDLWRHELPETHEINALVSVTPMTFLDYKALAHRLRGQHEAFQGAARDGRYVLKARQSMADRIIRGARFQNVAGHQVPVVNTPVLQSEVCNQLCQDYPDAPFAMAWWVMANGDTGVSLRSIGEFDVSALAGRYGGGGHKNAAGKSFQSVNDMARLLGMSLYPEVTP